MKNKNKRFIKPKNSPTNHFVGENHFQVVRF